MEGLTSIVLSLGSNLGDRTSYLQQATQQLKSFGEITGISSTYETPPVGFEADTNFLNICIELDTHLSPKDLLSGIHSIESEMGRIRSEEGYISRTIDIDIIFFGEQILQSETLHIPHPSFRERKFVLKPLIDLGIHRTDPVTHLTVEQLLNNCIDKTPISVYEFQVSAHD